MKKARTECQSHKLTVEDPVTLEYITRYVASMKQRWKIKLRYIVIVVVSLHSDRIF